LENDLKKVYNIGRDDWDLRVHVVLWAYMTTRKNLTGKTYFRLVYSQEAMMSMDFILTSLCVAAIIELSYFGTV
jgi:hypothetical protein